MFCSFEFVHVVYVFIFKRLVRNPCPIFSPIQSNPLFRRLNYFPLSFGWGTRSVLQSSAFSSEASPPLLLSRSANQLSRSRSMFLTAEVLGCDDKCTHLSNSFESFNCAKPIRGHPKPKRLCWGHSTISPAPAERERRCFVANPRPTSAEGCDALPVCTPRTVINDYQQLERRSRVSDESIVYSCPDEISSLCSCNVRIKGFIKAITRLGGKEIYQESSERCSSTLPEPLSQRNLLRQHRKSRPTRSSATVPSGTLYLD